MSDLNKHTPGPWTKSGSVIRSIASSERKVAEVRVIDDEGQANANLIAAAPDLLEALETIKRRMYEPRKFMLEDLEALIDQAIAKARGQS